MSVWETERKEIATWLSGYLAMIKKWVDRILDNEDHDVIFVISFFSYRLFESNYS